MPDRKIMREANLKMAQADRQAVFKGDCARCHAEPAKFSTGHTMYRQLCGICHDAKPRASFVPELRMINHPMDYEFWRTNIAYGHPGTMMPAFAKSEGGPLTDEQIDMLAKDCLKGMPYIPRSPAELQSVHAGEIVIPAAKGGTK
jgi:mono/diheme cytochrome c family protein